MRRTKQNRLSREVVQSTSLEVSRSDRTKPRATFFDLRADPAGAGLETSTEVPSNLNDSVIPRKWILCSRAPRLSKVSAKNTWWSQMTKSNSSSYWQCESLQVSYGLLLTPNRDELKIHCNQTGIFIWETLTLEICQTSDEMLAVWFLKRKGEQDLANSQLLTKEIVKKMSLRTCRLH